MKNRTLSPVAQLFLEFAREVPNRLPDADSYARVEKQHAHPFGQA